MSSQKSRGADPFDGIDFERDVTTTAADLEALARARFLRPMTAEEYQQWCDLVFAHHPPTLSAADRANTDADAPFTL